MLDELGMVTRDDAPEWAIVGMVKPIRCDGYVVFFVSIRQ